jgi:hypothetical protein
MLMRYYAPSAFIDPSQTLQQAACAWSKSLIGSSAEFRGVVGFAQGSEATQNSQQRETERALRQ